MYHSYTAGTKEANQRRGFCFAISKAQLYIEDRGWRTCLDPAAEAIEVDSTHVGMAVNPDVYRVIASALTRRTAERELALAA